MASSVPYHIPVSAAQVATYFVAQYYQVLQQQPEFVHQFYSDASAMLRIDGSIRESAATMLQIHALTMSLNYTGIEIRTAHSLESWNGGVLVMVSGYVQVKGFDNKRKFVETFFLAPQEKGYFVLNDVFHFTDEEPTQHHPAVLLAQSHPDSKLNSPSAIPEPVPTYLVGGEIQAREFVAPADIKENDPVDSYTFPEKRLHQASQSENMLEENSVEKPNGSLKITTSNAPDRQPATVEEPAGEPQKHTYASILRVAKGQSATSVTLQPSVNKNVPPTSEWNHASQVPVQQSTVMSNSFERSEAETAEEIYEALMLLPNIAGLHYSNHFVSLCNVFSILAGSAIVGGRQVYIEERRPNSNIPFRSGRGRGRGRVGYPTDAPRGRFSSRSFGRGGNYDGIDRDYNRPRGNGYHKPGPPRQDRGFSGHQVSRNGPNETD
ncbi:RAS GTPASE-ACTIVATING PROTEIN-BINDING PROTEIN [Salix purpurea]|uniref:RAS GTPASE-ACTIVATING PROTEIN-BINDING PROTEIN n=1 Tax=Salix purpurea TaxID=77065 RepID=A0A9Q0Z2X1_SALPP|nr:RAS GTPASE-ACTIVATING PROTEIN-BINDING PROTEIN [Salix purpurea]